MKTIMGQNSSKKNSPPPDPSILSFPRSLIAKPSTDMVGVQNNYPTAIAHHNSPSYVYTPPNPAIFAESGTLQQNRSTISTVGVLNGFPTKITELKDSPRPLTLSLPKPFVTATSTIAGGKVQKMADLTKRMSTLAVSSTQTVVKKTKAPKIQTQFVKRRIKNKEMETKRIRIRKRDGKEEVKGAKNKNKTKLLFKYDHYGKLLSGDELGDDFKQETDVVAIDCEMVGVGPLCESTLARVSIVNRHGYCLYDKFAKPNLPVTEYRTCKSGVREEDLVDAKPHDLVIEEVASLLHGKVVVGHSVHHDFEVLQLVHPPSMIRDTSIYYKQLLNRKSFPSLKVLSGNYLNLKIQDGEHSSIVDAQATMLLYLREEANWEKSLNQPDLPFTPPGVSGFRVMSIIPRRGDLDGDAEFVRPIQVDSPYSHEEEYKDTMFRLLREDFMKPLREGYRQYWRWVKTKQNKDKPKTVRIFEGVRVILAKGSLELKDRQQITIPKKCSTTDSSSTSEESKILINGSLLLFIPNTSENCHSVKVATVVRTTEEDDNRFYKKGILKVMFVKDGPSWTVQENTTFTVLESVAFFEAYRYALASLQTINLSKMPIGKYVLDPTIRFRSLHSNFSSFDFSKQIVALDPAFTAQHGGFPSALQLGLTKGQYEAYREAITKELTIIQGPPGTGKTFIAMKIIKFFLHNPHLLNGRPILVISNTNHSLDHVMEKVVLYAEEMTGSQHKGDNIVLRLGGMCKSPIVKRVTLKEKDLAYSNKTHVSCMLANARQKFSLIKNLSSLKLENTPDLDDIDDLKRTKAYLKVTKIDNLQAPADAVPNPNEDKESNLHACMFEAVNSVLEAVQVRNLVLARQNLAQLQRKAALPLLLNVVADKIKSLEKEYEALGDVPTVIQAIRAAHVIGATVCGFIKQREGVLDKVNPALVIVEEAAHVIESTVVAGLTEYCKRLVLIGDHKQLRPSTADHDLTVANHLDVSIMERFVQTAEAKGLKTWNQLDVQRRMRPEISKLICPTIYEELYNDPSVNAYPNVKGMEKNLYFIDHDERDSQAEDSTSFVNVMEAQFVINLCLYLIKQGNVPEKISIIATYLGQKHELEKMMRKTGYFDKVRICCVDGFQGEENDIILLSLVRSNDERNIGFLRTNNRVCVALSRARHGLYIVGNMNGLASRSHTWNEIKQTLMQGGHIGPKLRLKCVFHGGSVTSVGMQSSDKSFQVVANGKTRKCFCELKNAQGNSSSTATKTAMESLPLRRSVSAVYVNSVFQNGAFVGVLNGAPETSQNVAPKAIQNGKQASKRANKRLGCGYKFSCGHLCNQKCNKTHPNYQCAEPCIRICNGGHKCPGNHRCYLACDNLNKCLQKVNLACANCKKKVQGICSDLLPYYGRQHQLYGVSIKTLCDNCK